MACLFGGKTMKRPARPPSQLSGSLRKRLGQYALAANAAGVGVLALVQPAEAKIVYTPADRKIDCKPYKLDLNHDGLADFLIGYNRGCGEYRGSPEWVVSLRAAAVGRNGAEGGPYGTRGRSFAFALSGGAKIGGGASSHFVGGLMAFYSISHGQETYRSGPWLSATDRYLGLKFFIDGKVHYGWARMTVQFRETTVLTGYAYETIPNKPIIAGKTKGPDVITIEPASLGHLAAGASAIPAWRVKSTAATSH
jgi:hypothetical protein